MIKVLIADDARLVRMLLREILSRQPDMSVVGEACNGRDAVDKTLELEPDLVIMDVVMPVMDGLTAVREIMARRPTPILVLSGNVDPKDSKCAFQAIKLGALDVMPKPAGGLQAGQSFIGPLVEKVRLLARVPVMHHFRGYRQPVVQKTAVAPNGPRTLLAVGASTGGPKAVLQLLQTIPLSLGLQVLVVQHIARGFGAGFATWLDRESPYRVRVACEGDVPESGVVLVAPDDLHMQLWEGRVHLCDSLPVNSCRPSVDVLYHSLAVGGASSVIAVLLSGMGQDGAAGMVALKKQGSYNIAQDKESCAVYGMPGAAVARNAVQQELPLEQIPEAVVALARGRGKSR